jgi:hypothetical protein
VSEQSARPGWLTLLRDVASYLIGATILAKQAGIGLMPPAHPNETLMWIGASLIGGPLIGQLIQLRFGRPPPTPADAPTGGGGSSSPAPASPPPQ